MRSQSPNTQPICMKTEKPLLVTTQVKLVDPADRYALDLVAFMLITQIVGTLSILRLC